MKDIRRILSIVVFGVLIYLNAFSQSNKIDIDYYTPKEYEVGGIEILGADHLDHNSVILLSGISVGEKIFIPSDKISIAIDKLWKQGIFEDVQILVSKVEGKTIFLTYKLDTKPRLLALNILGVKRAEADKLKEKMHIASGDVVTENLKTNCKNIIYDHFADKGYYSVNTEIEEIRDTTGERKEVFLKFHIDKGEKIRIGKINITGNSTNLVKSSKLYDLWWKRWKSEESLTKLEDRRVRSEMKNTKEQRWWRFWKSSRFIDDEYQDDKKLVLNEYYNNGFRDAKIIKDSVYIIDTYKRK